MEAGIESVVIAGTTGESPTLSDEEKLELFSRAKEYIGDSSKIIAGTGSNSTVHTISLSMAAEKCGVEAMWLHRDGDRSYTPGFEKLIRT